MDDETTPEDELFGAAVYYAKWRRRVLETLGNEPGCMEKLERAKQDLREAARAYVVAPTEGDR